MSEPQVLAWVRAFHLIFMVCWFAGLFYLPRLFVNHAMVEDPSTRERLVLMEGPVPMSILREKLETERKPISPPDFMKVMEKNK